VNYASLLPCLQFSDVWRWAIPTNTLNNFSSLRFNTGRKPFCDRPLHPADAGILHRKLAKDKMLDVKAGNIQNQMPDLNQVQRSRR